MQFKILFRLFWLMPLLGPTILLAEQQIYPFSPAYSKPRQNGFESQQYYWRPLSKEEEYRGTPSQNWRPPVDLTTRGYSDEADSHLPNESTIPAPGIQGMAPYGQGFRFRPLSEAEMARIKSRNVLNHDSGQATRFRPQKSTEARAIGFSTKKQYRFRPDPRLERDSDRTPQRYSLEPPLKRRFPTPAW